MVANVESEVLESAFDGDGAVGGGHGGGDGRTFGAEELLENFEGIENGSCDGEGGDVVMEGSEKKGFLEAGMRSV